MEVLEAAERAAAMKMFELGIKADQAGARGRYARTEEICQRVLAVAEAALPPDSLLIVMAVLHLMDSILFTGMPDVKDVSSVMHLRAVWQTDARRLQLGRRCLRILDARWRAGTLFEPTPVEVFYCNELSATDLPARTFGGVELISIAMTTFLFWPPQLAPDEAEEKLRGSHSALLAAIELDARLGVELRTASAETMAIYKRRYVHEHIKELLKYVLSNAAFVSQLRSVCGISRKDATSPRRGACSRPCSSRPELRLQLLRGHTACSLI